jgi:hypothetical protein
MLRVFSTIAQDLRKQEVTCEAGRKIGGLSHGRATIATAPKMHGRE